LRAELSAHLQDLRRARARIVAASDDRRRGLERDLHDSAQQRLLAVGYDLRLAHAAAHAASNDELATALAGAGSDTSAVLDALRLLARGIFPAILDEAGLGPALETLAEIAPLPVEIRAVPEARVPAPVELAMYLVVQTAVQAASSAGASYAVVDIAREGDAVSCQVSTDAAVSLDVPMPLQDRLGALGGRALAAGNAIQAGAPCG
jgi:signal transduction histidine kinase